tara:strand:- start:4664 stop:5581 length:918 start_codon:yes stop_codon:yes gene_type:complete
MNYWTLIKEGYTTNQIRTMFSHDLEKLGSEGGFYTASEFASYAEISTSKATKYFKTCYNSEVIQNKLNIYIETVPATSVQIAIDFLNKSKLFTRTGRAWTPSAFSSSNLEIENKKKPKHHRHLSIWKLFDEHRSNFESYNQAVIFFNTNNYYQESGKPWSRQLFSIIIQSYPELDWSLPNRKQNKFTRYSKEYEHLSSDLINSYDTYEEMISSLGLPGDANFKKFLSTKNLDRASWKRKRLREIEDRIILLLTEDSNISYANLWRELSILGYFDPLAKRKSQRMYNFMKKNNLLEIKRKINERKN